MMLENKVALITGGASGLGAAITRVFVERGARVVLVDLQADSGYALAEELGSAATFVEGDVTDRAVADRAVATAVREHGRIDALVNNAAASRTKPLLEQTEADWRLALDTGLIATRNFMLAAHSQLASSRGAIVNFGSGAGLDGQPNQGSYAASKEAVRGLSRVASNEWARDGIRVNVVCPMAKTGGVQQWAREHPEQYEATSAKVPLGRFGDPDDDVAPVVAFLASDDSRYVTGQTIMADGGTIKLR